MEPVILALEEKYDREITFIIVDVDDPQGNRLAREFDIYYIPAFFFIASDGNISGEDVGWQSFEGLEQRILLYLLAK